MQTIAAKKIIERHSSLAPKVTWKQVYNKLMRFSDKVNNTKVSDFAIDVTSKLLHVKKLWKDKSVEQIYSKLQEHIFMVLILIDAQIRKYEFNSGFISGNEFTLLSGIRTMAKDCTKSLVAWGDCEFMSKDFLICVNQSISKLVDLYKFDKYPFQIPDKLLLLYDLVFSFLYVIDDKKPRLVNFDQEDFCSEMYWEPLVNNIHDKDRVFLEDSETESIDESTISCCSGNEDSDDDQESSDDDYPVNNIDQPEIKINFYLDFENISDMFTFETKVLLIHDFLEIIQRDFYVTFDFKIVRSIVIPENFVNDSHTRVSVDICVLACDSFHRVQKLCSFLSTHEFYYSNPFKVIERIKHGQETNCFWWDKKPPQIDQFYLFDHRGFDLYYDPNHFESKICLDDWRPIDHCAETIEDYEFRINHPSYLDEPQTWRALYWNTKFRKIKSANSWASSELCDNMRALMQMDPEGAKDLVYKQDPLFINKK